MRSLKRALKEHCKITRYFYLPLLMTIHLFASSAYGIVIRHDKSDGDYRVLAKNYSQSVAYLDKCVATVLSKYWLITAAHCVSPKNSYPVYITHLNKKYPVTDIVLHPKAQQFDDLDIALLKLNWPLENAQPVGLYSGSDELNRKVTFVGNGKTGNGLSGETKADGIERAATNIVNSVENNWITFLFNNDNNSTELEGISGSEDSGGPALITTDSGVYIIGLSCCQEPATDNQDNEKPGGYNSVEHYTRLSPHKKWIDQQTSNSSHSFVKSEILLLIEQGHFTKAKNELVKNKGWMKNVEFTESLIQFSLYHSNKFTMYLLDKYPFIRGQKIQGLPLIAYSYLQGNSEVLTQLIQLSAGIDYSGVREQQLPSLLTWQYFQPDYINQLTLLKNKGLDINHQDTKGYSALHMAVLFNLPKKVSALLKLGVDTELQDKNGNTALTLAEKANNQMLIKLLTEAKLNTPV